jgi:hypothetical protein
MTKGVKWLPDRPIASHREVVALQRKRAAVPGALPGVTDLSSGQFWTNRPVIPLATGVLLLTARESWRLRRNDRAGQLPRIRPSEVRHRGRTQGGARLHGSPWRTIGQVAGARKALGENGRRRFSAHMERSKRSPRTAYSRSRPMSLESLHQGRFVPGVGYRAGGRERQEYTDRYHPRRRIAAPLRFYSHGYHFVSGLQVLSP